MILRSGSTLFGLTESSSMPMRTKVSASVGSAPVAGYVIAFAYFAVAIGSIFASLSIGGRIELTSCLTIGIFL